jgi:hypothetical protein
MKWASLRQKIWWNPIPETMLIILDFLPTLFGPRKTVQSAVSSVGYHVNITASFSYKDWRRV